MKKFLALLITMAISMHTMADDFTYLTVESSDGNTTSMTAIGLTITFSNGQMIASNGSGSWTLDLNTLSRMYFSNTDGISQATGESVDGGVTIYGTNGIFMGTFSSLEEARSQLRKGIYIVKSGSKSIKTTVR